MSEITQEMINEWKTKYGEIYKIEISEEEYYYRPLKRAEYKSVIQTGEASANYREEQIATKCTIHPQIDPATMAALKAGVITTLTDCIMLVSGFGVDSEPIKL